MKNCKYKIGDKLLELFILVSLLDPANIFIGIKSKIFVILIIFLFVARFKINTRYILSLVLLFSISLFSSISGRIQGFEIDETLFNRYLFTFSVLILLLWYKIFDLIDKLYLPSIILSVLTIILYLIMLFSPDYEAIIYKFTLEHDMIFQLSHRSYLGVEFISCYYTPLIIVSIPCAFTFYRLIVLREHRIQNFLLTILFFTALFCGGNKACLFGIAFCILSVLFHFFYKKRSSRLMVLFCTPFVFLFLGNIMLKAVTESDFSNDVKKRHIESYMDLLNNHPSILITGMGAGAKFYSKGFGEKTALVEWQYLEILRWYGLLGGGFIICFCFFPSLSVLQSKNKYREWAPFVIGYLNFMLMSTGNPLLMNSTGMIVVLTGYTFMFHHKIKRKYGFSRNCSI